MNIFVDTSVWIAYFKGKDVDLITTFNHRLDRRELALAVPVWVELLSGASKEEVKLLKRVLSALPRFFPSENSWEQIDKWVEIGAQKGHRFGAMDLLIAAIVCENSGMLWTLDSDFKRMANLKWINLVRD